MEKRPVPCHDLGAIAQWHLLYVDQMIDNGANSRLGESGYVKRLSESLKNSDPKNHKKIVTAGYNPYLPKVSAIGLALVCQKVGIDTHLKNHGFDPPG